MKVIKATVAIDAILGTYISREVIAETIIINPTRNRYQGYRRYGILLNRYYLDLDRTRIFKIIKVIRIIYITTQYYNV
ncbi:MAG: hypothetical protein H7Y18_08130 [Clostridiaceae bacterium]|nr:hypothetical protein [Clostridiaceae bacterium]